MSSLCWMLNRFWWNKQILCVIFYGIVYKEFSDLLNIFLYLVFVRLLAKAGNEALSSKIFYFSDLEICDSTDKVNRHYNS